MKISWLVARLSCMSTAEVIYRLGISIKQKLEKYVPRSMAPKPKIGGRLCQPVFKVNTVIDKKDLILAANSVLEGRWDIFAKKNVDYGVMPDWNQDVCTGIKAPLLYGKTLDYRNNKLVGDIKYLWEPNRHLQLVTLAQAYSITQENSYKRGLVQYLESWIKANPYLMGPNWCSSLELGIRLINWAFVWELVFVSQLHDSDEEPADTFVSAWLSTIYNHQKFIAGHFSRYSSANNHLIGEAAGLFVASSIWPFWSESKEWRNQSYKILLEEVISQTHVDGVNKEQAISYQQFVLDFFIIAARAGEAVEHKFPDEFWAVIEKMLEYISAARDSFGNIPMLGDADDGYVVKLAYNQGFCEFESLLTTGAILLNRPDFLFDSTCLDDKTKWLLGEGCQEQYEALRRESAILSSRAKLCFFEDGGHYFIKDRIGTPEEIYMHFDAGDLGYRSIAAHGHADALSIAVFYGGKEFLVDPGTYAYHVQKKWRDYFKGTSAHNTIRVDHKDQSVSGGNFMWTRHAMAECISCNVTDESITLAGYHAGYNRLNDAVSHERYLRFDKANIRLIVVDIIHCKAGHVVEQFWHFSEHCEIDGQKPYIVSNGSRKISIATSTKFDCENLYLGSEAPVAGWISRKYDEKAPSYTLVCSAKIVGTTKFETIISFD